MIHELHNFEDFSADNEVATTPAGFHELRQRKGKGSSSSRAAAAATDDGTTCFLAERKFK